MKRTLIFKTLLNPREKPSPPCTCISGGFFRRASGPPSGMVHGEGNGHCQPLLIPQRPPEPALPPPKGFLRPHQRRREPARKGLPGSRPSRRDEPRSYPFTGPTTAPETRTSLAGKPRDDPSVFSHHIYITKTEIQCN